MAFDFSLLFLIFITYSTIGWITEVVFVAIKQKKITRRGFLIGPYCPIYGFSGTIMILLLYKYQTDPIIIFILAALIASFIEYITSYVLEKIFRVRWWDYSDQPFNINGRIILLNSVLFGILGLSLIYFVHPIYENILNSLNNDFIITVSFIIFSLFIIDFILTTRAMLSIRKDIKPMLKDRTEEFSLFIRKEIDKRIKRAQRIIKAFPNSRPVKKNKKRG